MKTWVMGVFSSSSEKGMSNSADACPAGESKTRARYPPPTRSMIKSKLKYDSSPISSFQLKEISNGENIQNPYNRGCHCEGAFFSDRSNLPVGEETAASAFGLLAVTLCTISIYFFHKGIILLRAPARTSPSSRVWPLTCKLPGSV